MHDYRCKPLLDISKMALGYLSEKAYKIRVDGKAPQGSIITCNHPNFYDFIFPMVYGGGDYAWGKKEVFNIPILREYLTYCGVIPVNSKPHLAKGEEYTEDISLLLGKKDRERLLLDVRDTIGEDAPLDWRIVSAYLVMNNQTLVSYTEGTRVQSYSIKEVKTGAAKVWIDVFGLCGKNAPIVPMFLGYAKDGELYLPGKTRPPMLGSTVHITIGEPISLDDLLICPAAELESKIPIITERYRQGIIECKTKTLMRYSLIEKLADISHATVNEEVGDTRTR